MHVALLIPTVFLSALSLIAEGQVMMDPTSDSNRTVNFTKILLETGSDSNATLNLTDLLIRFDSDNNSTINFTNLLPGSSSGTSFNRTIIITERFGHGPDSESNRTVIVTDRFETGSGSDLPGAGSGEGPSDSNRTINITDHVQTGSSSDLPSAGSDQGSSNSNRTSNTSGDTQTGAGLELPKAGSDQRPSDSNMTGNTTDDSQTGAGSELPTAGSDQRPSDSNRTSNTTGDTQTGAGSELPTAGSDQRPSDFNRTSNTTDDSQTGAGSELPTAGSDQRPSDSNRTSNTTGDTQTGTGSELPTAGSDHRPSDSNRTINTTDATQTGAGTEQPTAGSDQRPSDSNRTSNTSDDSQTGSGSELPTAGSDQGPSDSNRTGITTDHPQSGSGSDLPTAGSDQRPSDSNGTTITTGDSQTGSGPELPTAGSNQEQSGSNNIISSKDQFQRKSPSERRPEQPIAGSDESGPNNTDTVKEQFRTAIDERTGLKLPRQEKTDHVPSVKIPRLPVDQGELIALCAKKCKTELCYLADETDCRSFITCQRDSHGGLLPENYHAIRQPCAFGTYWAGLQKQKKITCDLPQNVLCNIDYCAGKPYGSRYNHLDGNCKTYWECDGLGNPIPKCCHEGYRYSDRVDMCVEDTIGTCHDRCPIEIDACLVPGTKTEFFDDGNCRTYWDCEDQHPHPVCCPEGQGYDVVKGCVENPNCKDECPKQYKPDICIQPGVEKYSLIDGSCRTYMKCNPVRGDERWCCPPNFVFVGENQTCIERTPDMNLRCNDQCPRHFNEECQLRSVPGEIDTFYIQTSIGPIKLPCAPGTLFDAKKCGCGKVNKNITNNACNKELDIIFDAPMWHRHGSQKHVEFKPVWHKLLPNGEYVLSEVGTIEEGPKLEGMASAKFTGELFFRAPFFQSQYEKLYIRVVFLAELASPAVKRILLSNCMGIDLGAPPMELSLQGDRIVLELTTDDIRGNDSFARNAPVTASVPFTPGIWNSFTAIYDGAEVLLVNEGQGKPAFDRQPLSGPVSVAAEGLDVGGCFTRGPEDGFIGYISQLEFSKCVKGEWIAEFNTRLAVP